MVELVVPRDAGMAAEGFRFEGLLYEVDLRDRFLVVALHKLLLVRLNEEYGAAIRVDEADRDHADALEDEQEQLLARHPDRKDEEAFDAVLYCVRFVKQVRVLQSDAAEEVEHFHQISVVVLVC